MTRTFWACSIAMRASSSCRRLSPSEDEEPPASLPLQKQKSERRQRPAGSLVRWATDAFGRRKKDGGNCSALRAFMIDRNGINFDSVDFGRGICGSLRSAENLCIKQKQNIVLPF